MKIAIVTGSAGLVGSEVCRRFSGESDRVVGIDNDMRRRLFGDEASTAWNAARLREELGPRYSHANLDIRDAPAIDRLFAEYGGDIALVVHAAAQPSHDWAARDPATDFGINATGTLNLLEATRRHAPAATFIHVSTNKVYGDTPNRLPFIERETRWEVAEGHPFASRGIDETMSIDHSTHSLFGVSKAAGDLLAQEYGRYFGMKTGIFRGGCLSGPAHAGAELHGFLSYLMLCVVAGRPYTIHGYQGKQVRDTIHSRDLVEAFAAFHRAPRPGAVYNIGGSRHSHCSMREAIALCESIAGKKLDARFADEPRIGDHIWYVSDVRKFQRDYPEWQYQYGLEDILKEIHDAVVERING
jgi:CDP-paratose 2-epimerase